MTQLDFRLFSLLITSVFSYFVRRSNCTPSRLLYWLKLIQQRCINCSVYTKTRNGNCKDDHKLSV